jgi:hypothetical protein
VKPLEQLQQVIVSHYASSLLHDPFNGILTTQTTCLVGHKLLRGGGGICVPFECWRRVIAGEQYKFSFSAEILKVYLPNTMQERNSLNRKPCFYAPFDVINAFEISRISNSSKDLR